VMTISRAAAAVFVVWAVNRSASDVSRTANDATQTNRVSERFFTWKRGTGINFGFCILKQKQMAKQDFLSTYQDRLFMNTIRYRPAISFRIYVLDHLEPVLKIGGAGDPPTGTAASNVAKRPRPL